MNNKYIVVANGQIIGDSSQQGPAQDMAEGFAAANVGEEAILYRNEAVFTARVVVDNSYPKFAEEPK